MEAEFVICVCLRIMVSNTYCVMVIFIFLCPALPVSLDCQFFIAPSVFSTIYSIFEPENVASNF